MAEKNGSTPALIERWAIFDEYGRCIASGFPSKGDALRAMPPTERASYKALPYTASARKP